MRTYVTAAAAGVVVAVVVIGQEQRAFNEFEQAVDEQPDQLSVVRVDATLFAHRDKGQIAQLAATSPAIQWQGNDLHIARIGFGAIVA